MRQKLFKSEETGVPFRIIESIKINNEIRSLEPSLFFVPLIGAGNAVDIRLEFTKENELVITTEVNERELVSTVMSMISNKLRNFYEKEAEVMKMFDSPDYPNHP